MQVDFPLSGTVSGSQDQAVTATSADVIAMPTINIT